MCTDDQTFTTIVGPRRSVKRLLEIFSDTMVAVRHDLRSVELIELTRASPEFADLESPAVVVVYHTASKGFAVAAELQAELMTGHRRHGVEPLPDLLCEPGYEFETASGGSGPNVAIHQTGITRLRATAPAVSSADRVGGTRVAVLDTGAKGVSNDMVDFVSSAPAAKQSDDVNGHGTAVTEIITTLAPSADIYPVRVIGTAHTNKGPSYRVLAGLAYALWSGEFDIVNASLTTTSGHPCETSLGGSISYIARICHNQRPGTVPPIVAAAGNQSLQRSGYPALVPGAIVAMALEEDPAAPGTYKRAAYNCKPPQPANEQEAFGGSRSDPIGTISVGARSGTPFYGTSFAAAAITAAYLP
jgi:hypothetical protein